MRMPDRKQVQDAVFRAIDRMRELSLDESGLTSQESTVLLGEGAVLDSMSFVNFVVALEEEMSRVTDQPLNIAEMLSSPEPHVASVSTAGQLIDFLRQSFQ